MMVEKEMVFGPLSSGFFVIIFWADDANVVNEWSPLPALGLKFEDLFSEFAMVGNEVLGGRRLVKAAATDPCSSGRPPNPATGVVVATPPTEVLA